ncbi:site-specific integrase [Jeotgalibaca sp. MA1X17-3]|uniref:tyrosine-type recombinase/integrase n=1 Tax=Jeotgalibaca sp. MA1X17-3 TaxID=2908211 RepID=UPI001F1F0576|nr:tyrosine-type recombinase/integrase [Jeotgalibaca sp. MA1X17-3]UJF14998.1 site-specific integrase [Jeotgalibaca sp. MA1X17-3]
MIKEYLKKDGSKAFMFTAYLGVDPLTGKQRRTTRRGFSTRKEASLAKSRLLVDVEENGIQKQNKTTFQELYVLWYESAYKDTVKESTRVKTKELFDLHILPAFGTSKIDKISIKACQLVVNQWCKRFVKYRSMKAYTSKVLDYAVTLEMIRDNPMKKIVMPKKIEEVDEEVIENYYTKEELQTFLICCKEDLASEWFTFFRLLAFSGLRKSEAFALTWKDIDFKGKTVSISKALARGEQNRLIIQSPKNKSSVRTISMDATTLAILKEWRKEQAITMLKYGHNTMNDTQLVFSTSTNKFIDPNASFRHIEKVIQLNGLSKITTHGLRHTHCSLLFESDAPIQVVKERLGHSDIQTTMNIYTHVTEKSKEDTAEKFAQYVNF